MLGALFGLLEAPSSSALASRLATSNAHEETLEVRHRPSQALLARLYQHLKPFVDSTSSWMVELRDMWKLLLWVWLTKLKGDWRRKSRLLRIKQSLARCRATFPHLSIPLSCFTSLHFTSNSCHDLSRGRTVDGSRVMAIFIMTCINNLVN
jgi:hypothetical protein